MPKRTKVDLDILKEAYLRLGNGRTVAIELGIHPNTVYQNLRKLSGKCKNCSSKISVGESFCDICKKHIANRAKQKRKQKIRNGICISCNKQRSNLSKLYCEEHRIQAAERSANHNAKKAKSRKSKGKTSPEDRIRAISWKYGKYGVEIWKNANGCCSVCGSSHNDISVHIHHIDRNTSNNSIQNLICLCFNCHMLTHKILEVKDLEKFLKWFRNAYPDIHL